MSRLYPESNKSIILVIIAIILIGIFGHITLDCLEKVGLKNIIAPLWHGEQYQPGNSNNEFMESDTSRQGKTQAVQRQ